MRGIVAVDSGTPRPSDSPVFGPDTLAMRHLDDVVTVDVLDAESLPNLKMDPEDPATAYILGTLVPGELAPMLAIGMAAELAGDRVRAIANYDFTSKCDPNYATSVFGLARCLAAEGQRTEAVAALGRIPQTSNLYPNAQKTIAAILIRTTPNAPSIQELEKAGSTIDALLLEGKEKFRIMREVFTVALDLITGNKIKEDATKVLGHSLQEIEIRKGLEGAYRNLARITDDKDQRIALVDMANSVRPKTWF
jgi:serine/threonine-protein kinase PknG